MKKIVFFVMCVATLMMASCGQGTKGNAEADSLRTELDGKLAEMSEMDLFLEAVNASMDSVINMEGTVLRSNGGENAPSTKEQIMQNIDAYKLILQNQHARLAELEKKLQAGDANAKKMLKTIEALKAQVADKDAAIATLTSELEKANFNIGVLKQHVERLNVHVAQLQQENQMQQEELEAQTDLMNEAYVFIGSKKELKEAGLMTGGNLLKKSKLDLSSVDATKFQKIDIRNTKSFDIPAKKAEILTQTAAGSYTMTQNENGTTTLTITDPTRFWTVSNFLVIRY